MLEHLPGRTELSLGLGAVDFADKGGPLLETHVSPVYSILVVAVVWLQQRLEDTSLVDAHVGKVCGCDMVSTGVGTMRHRKAVISDRHVDAISVVTASKLGGKV